MGLDRASSALSRLHVSVRVPTELWGAANALAAGLCSTPLCENRGHAAQPLRAVRLHAMQAQQCCCWHAGSVCCQVLLHITLPLFSQVSDAADSSALGMPPQLPESMRERLDFRPALQRKEVHAWGPFRHMSAAPVCSQRHLSRLHDELCS